MTQHQTPDAVTQNQNPTITHPNQDQTPIMDTENSDKSSTVNLISVSPQDQPTVSHSQTSNTMTVT